jgi:hypothetical protein
MNSPSPGDGCTVGSSIKRGLSYTICFQLRRHGFEVGVGQTKDSPKTKKDLESDETFGSGRHEGIWVTESQGLVCRGYFHYATHMFDRAVLVEWRT